ncbi:signal transduction histidine kinase [Kineosphaera limosa]|uniref:sensor histidine kinase n=1 Tax=Kineosphaera limosa TaxID=111564 RepID=UPI00184A7D1E|nr:sensor histidine kinase [Kineosphaera limosa]NYE01531.1 signal transduction histidine kinase [Kineosphaera limosa]
MSRVSLIERFAAWIGVDEPWERDPGPGRAVQDARVACGFIVGIVVSLEVMRSLGLTEQIDFPVWQQYAILVAGVLPLFVRRRFPLAVAAATQLHFFVVAMTMGLLAYQFVFQVMAFFGLYSGVAWARDRRALLVLLGAVMVWMAGWLAWDFALGNSIAQITEDAAGRQAAGLLSAPVAYVLYTIAMNFVFYGGALLFGQNSWRSARRLAILTEQADTIAEQAQELRDQAVVEERLRIARELHDVVAHHVSVMGVQAAAARRVLDRRPEAAVGALSHIEESSRQAVAEMRRLLGTLRSGSSTPEASREPGPGLAGIPDLVRQSRSPGFDLEYMLVEEPDGSAASVPGPMALSVYRIVQEALANVRKHSSANRVTVAVRVRGAGADPGYVEAEVVDNGRPLGATSGTGLGLLGMRERIASHGGAVEAGPRLSGGYRVRVRFPLTAAKTITPEHES